MNILGIETSCDETAASIVKDGKVILSNVVASSLKEHAKYGGIIPEIASRHQLELINGVVATSLKNAKLDLKDISCLAVTQTPGLIGSLLVGLSYARALSFSAELRLIEVNHIKAHLYSNFIVAADSQLNKNQQECSLPTLPAIGLIVSGGHTSLYHIKKFSDYQLLGQTQDDAAGEAFDKVARILKLGYPGGPIIDRLAQKVKGTQLTFPHAELKNTFDFSFSGTKTSVLYYTKKQPQLTPAHISEIVYAFQRSVVKIIVKKSLQACQYKNIKTIVVGGGVAANFCLRKTLINEAELLGIKVFFPPLSLCVDNAAMIAGYAYHQL